MEALGTIRHPIDISASNRDAPSLWTDPRSRPVNTPGGKCAPTRSPALTSVAPSATASATWDSRCSAAAEDASADDGVASILSVNFATKSP